MGLITQPADLRVEFLHALPVGCFHARACRLERGRCHRFKVMVTLCGGKALLRESWPTKISLMLDFIPLGKAIISISHFENTRSHAAGIAAEVSRVVQLRSDHSIAPGIGSLASCGRFPHALLRDDGGGNRRRTRPY